MNFLIENFASDFCLISPHHSPTIHQPCRQIFELNPRHNKNKKIPFKKVIKKTSKTSKLPEIMKLDDQRVITLKLKSSQHFTFLEPKTNKNTDNKRILHTESGKGRLQLNSLFFYDNMIIIVFCRGYMRKKGRISNAFHFTIILWIQLVASI